MSSRRSGKKDPSIISANSANDRASITIDSSDKQRSSRTPPPAESQQQPLMFGSSPTGGLSSADYGGNGNSSSFANHHTNGGGGGSAYYEGGLHSSNGSSKVSMKSHQTTTNRMVESTPPTSTHSMQGNTAAANGDPNNNGGKPSNVFGNNNNMPHAYQPNNMGGVAVGGGGGGGGGATASNSILRDIQPRDEVAVDVMGSLGGGGGRGRGSALPSCMILTVWLLLLLAGTTIFIFGVTGSAVHITGLEGWDEVFTVCGMLVMFPILLFLYRFISPMIPKLSAKMEGRVSYYTLRCILVGSFILQASLFLVYLTKYNDRWYFFFVIPDVVICVLMLISTKLTTIWAHLYVIVMALKMGLFWFNLDPSEGPNLFQEKNNVYGINGFLAVLMLILPMVHYPVIISRLEAGMTMTDAYTTNMAAVFAHILHGMDSLELYMQGQDRQSFAADVQYMLLLFALMGFVAGNLYFIALFFRDEAAEKIIRRFQSNVMENLEGSRDESLLHYFMWSLFMIDLPYASMRFIAFCVHGTMLSPFFAKNIVMIGSVTMLLFYNNYQHVRSEKETAKGSEGGNSSGGVIAVSSGLSASNSL